MARLTFVFQYLLPLILLSIQLTNALKEGECEGKRNFHFIT